MSPVPISLRLEYCFNSSRLKPYLDFQPLQLNVHVPIYMYMYKLYSVYTITLCTCIMYLYVHLLSVTVLLHVQEYEDALTPFKLREYSGTSLLRTSEIRTPL